MAQVTEMKPTASRSTSWNDPHGGGKADDWSNRKWRSDSRDTGYKRDQQEYPVRSSSYRKPRASVCNLKANSNAKCDDDSQDSDDVQIISETGIKPGGKR